MFIFCNLVIELDEKNLVVGPAIGQVKCLGVCFETVDKKPIRYKLLPRST